MKPERHPNGFYYGRVSRNGKRVRVNLGRNLRAAVKKAREISGQAATGSLSVGEIETTRVVEPDGGRDMRVHELVHRHLDWVERRRSPSTLALRQRCIRRFLAHIGDRMVSEITRDDVEGFFDAERRKHGRGPNAGNKALINVKAMFAWGCEFRHCDPPPFSFPKLEQTDPQCDIFMDDEISLLLGRAQPDFRDLLEFGLLTGLRPQELRGLTKRHVLSDGTGGLVLSIPHHKTAKTTRIRKPRSVPLGAAAAAIVRRQTAKHPKSEYIFLNGTKGPYERTALRNRLLRLCRRVKIPPRSPYVLRHCAATRMAALGVNQTILAQILGHSNLQTTARYVSNTDEAHRRAVTMLEASVLGGCSPSAPGVGGTVVDMPLKKAG